MGAPRIRSQSASKAPGPRPISDELVLAEARRLGMNGQVFCARIE